LSPLRFLLLRPVQLTQPTFRQLQRSYTSSFLLFEHSRSFQDPYLQSSTEDDRFMKLNIRDAPTKIPKNTKISRVHDRRALFESAYGETNDIESLYTDLSEHAHRVAFLCEMAQTAPEDVDESKLPKPQTSPQELKKNVSKIHDRPALFEHTYGETTDFVKFRDDLSEHAHRVAFLCEMSQSPPEDDSEGLSQIPSMSKMQQYSSKPVVASKIHSRRALNDDDYAEVPNEETKSSRNDSLNELAQYTRDIIALCEKLESLGDSGKANPKLIQDLNERGKKFRDALEKSGFSHEGWWSKYIESTNQNNHPK